MTDITNKLEYLASFRGVCEMRLEPSEVDHIAKIGAEALAEIRRLRAVVGEGMQFMNKPAWPVLGGVYTIVDGHVRHFTVDRHGVILNPLLSKSADWEKLGNDMVGSVVSTVDRALSGKIATQVIIDDPHEPAPEPWGSAFAMNTENWK